MLQVLIPDDPNPVASPDGALPNPEMAIDTRLSTFDKNLTAQIEATRPGASTDPLNVTMPWNTRFLESTGNVLPDSELGKRALEQSREIDAAWAAIRDSEKPDFSQLEPKLTALQSTIRQWNAEITAVPEAVKNDPEYKRIAEHLERDRRDAFYVPVKVTYENGELAVTYALFGKSEEIFRQKIKLPPGVKIDVFDDGLIRLQNENGDPFHSTIFSNDVRAGKSNPSASVFIRPSVSLGRDGTRDSGRFIVDGWDEMVISRQDNGLTMRQTGINDLTRYLERFYDEKAAAHEFAMKDTELSFPGGKLKVKGPNRLGEVELTDELRSILYNPATGEFRLANKGYMPWPGNIVGSEGGFDQGEVKLTLKRADNSESKVTVRPVFGNWHPAQSVKIFGDL